MSNASQTEDRKKRRGFTLTEITIVLGIVGTVLGAIWGAAAHVHSGQKTTKAVSEVMAIATGIRTQYATKGYVDAAVLDQFAISRQIYPPEMLVPGACTSPDGVTVTVGSCPNSAFGSYVSIGGQGDYCQAGAVVPCTSRTFTVVVWNIPAADCPAFMTSLIAGAAGNGLVAITPSAPVGPIAVSQTTDLTDAHIASCAGTAYLQFSL